VNDSENDQMRVPSSVFLIFVSTLLLATVFPLLPLWSVGMRLAALLFVWHHRRTLSATIGAPAIVYVVGMLALSGHLVFRIAGMLVSRPSWIIDRVLDVSGLTLPLADAVLLSLLDAALIGGLVWVVWRSVVPSWGAGWWHRVAVMAATGLVAWVFTVAAVNSGTGTAETAASDFNWLRLWMDWVICFLISMCMVSSDQKDLFVKTIVAGGAFHAALILAQFLAGDYSYVLESATSFDAYFFRVRGNYFYHGAVGQFLLIPLFMVFAAAAGGRGGKWLWPAGLLMLAALYLNGTRAISLAGAIGMTCVLVLNLPWCLRRVAPVAFATVAIAAFCTTVFYTKPTGQVSPNSGQTAGNTGQSVASSNRAHNARFVQSNSGRTQMFRNGLKTAMASPLIGHGPGNIKVPLDVPFGKFVTRSSHCLFIDMFLAGGIPAGVCFLLWWVVPALYLIYQRVFHRPDDVSCQSLAAAVGMFAAFGSSFLFFGLERCDTTSVFCALLGVFLVSDLRPAAEKDGNAIPFDAAVRFPERSVVFAAAGIAVLAALVRLNGVSVIAVMLGLTAVGCLSVLILRLGRANPNFSLRRPLYAITLFVVFGGALGGAATSSCYLWPAVEFAWRERFDPLWTHFGAGKVYTNSTGLAQSVNLVRSLLGGDREPVQVLKDDLAALPATGQILWNPGNDRNYPNLIRELGYLESRPFRRAPCFRMPQEWGVIRSKQMLVSFINVGPSMSPPLCPTDFGQVEINRRRVEEFTDQQFVKPASRIDFRFVASIPLRVSNGVLSCRFTTRGASAALETTGGRFICRGEIVAAGGIRIPIEATGRLKPGSQRVLLPLPSSEIRELTLTIENDRRFEFVAFRPELYWTLLPNTASHAVDIVDNRDRGILHVADDNTSSAWTFWSDQSNSVTFDFGDQRPAVSLYRLSGFPAPHIKRDARLNWKLAGSHGGDDWTVIDVQEGIVLPEKFGQFRSSLIRRPRAFRYYRLTVSPNHTQVAGMVGFSEIEMYCADHSHSPDLVRSAASGGKAGVKSPVYKEFDRLPAANAAATHERSRRD
jgi:hypothetical protein